MLLCMHVLSIRGVVLRCRSPILKTSAWPVIILISHLHRTIHRTLHAYVPWQRICKWLISWQLKTLPLVGSQTVWWAGTMHWLLHVSRYAVIKLPAGHRRLLRLLIILVQIGTPGHRWERDHGFGPSGKCVKLLGGLWMPVLWDKPVFNWH